MTTDHVQDGTSMHATAKSMPVALYGIQATCFHDLMPLCVACCVFVSSPTQSRSGPNLPQHPCHHINELQPHHIKPEPTPRHTSSLQA